MAKVLISKGNSYQLICPTIEVVSHDLQIDVSKEKTLQKLLKEKSLMQVNTKLLEQSISLCEGDIVLEFGEGDDAGEGSVKDANSIHVSYC